MSGLLSEPEQGKHDLGIKSKSNNGQQGAEQASKRPAARRRCRHLPAVRRALFSLIGRALSPMSGAAGPPKRASKCAASSHQQSANAMKRADLYQDKRLREPARDTRRALAEVSSAPPSFSRAHSDRPSTINGACRPQLAMQGQLEFQRRAAPSSRRASGARVCRARASSTASNWPSSRPIAVRAPHITRRPMIFSPPPSARSSCPSFGSARANRQSLDKAANLLARPC